MAAGEESTKDDLGKEQLQCMAFAHFAVHKYNPVNEQQHKDLFYSLFDKTQKPDLKTIREYKKYLSRLKFDFNRLYNNWAKIGVANPKVQIAYDVAKTFYTSNKISRNFQQYYFLDQESAFVKIIKNKCLDKIIKSLKLSFKVDILSSADIYIVKKNKLMDIIKEFKKEILNKKSLYLINNFTVYNELLIKYWKSHDMFGVSLKFPETIGGRKNIKIVGASEDVLTKKMKKNLDPYTKFLSLLSDKNTNIKKLINETIEIGSKDITKASWDFNFTFKYKKLKLYPTDVEFVLKAWTKAQKKGGGSAGFNGQFANNVPGYSTQWVGGTGIETLENFIFQYNEYNRIMRELSLIREKALNYTLTGSSNKKPNINQPIESSRTVPRIMFSKKKEDTSGARYKNETRKTLKVKNLQTFYSLALREIKAKTFNVGVNRNEELYRFLNEYEKQNKMPKNSLIKKYQMAVINLATKKSIGAIINQSDSMLKSFYEHAQISYFMLRGGSYYLKRKIFMTIFGVITKKGYNIIKDSDLGSTKLENAIRINAAKCLIKSVKSFDTVPHFYMS